MHVNDMMSQIVSNRRSVPQNILPICRKVGAVIKLQSRKRIDNLIETSSTTGGHAGTKAYRI